MKDFYSNLYKRSSSKSEIDCLNYLKNINVPKLSTGDMSKCKGRLPKQECWDALQSFGNNKSPGNDGLSKEFYVCFSNEINAYLIDSLNHSFQEGQLSTSQRQVIITLTEKKCKDKRYLKNWRPISLMNVDTKITSKAIATRLNTVIQKFIHHNQTAYVGNRYIGEANHLVSDILEFSAENEMEAILFSADFEKAFDSIEHPVLFATLKSYGFGTDFIQWVRTFLCKAESCVMNNGHSTEYFPLERGACQGDRLSCHLFILVLEILFVQIRENEEIQGIRIDTQGEEVKVSAYADDGNFLVLNLTHSLNLIFQTCHSFEQFCFLKLNLERSEACWISSARGKQDKPVDCNWINFCTDKIRTLGVFNSYDKDME